MAVTFAKVQKKSFQTKKKEEKFGIRAENMVMGRGVNSSFTKWDRWLFNTESAESTEENVFES